MKAAAICPPERLLMLDLRSVTQTLRVAREGTTEDERQPRTHSCPSQQRPAPAACCEETLRSVTVVSLHVETRVSISAGCARRRTRSRLSTFNNSPAPRRLAVWVRHDVQEAEEGELQRARLWTRVPGRRRLFPLVQVRQLQDCWLPDQLLRGVQLQDSGVLWWDAAQELQEGKSQRRTS